MLRTFALALLGLGLVQAASVHLIDSNRNAYLKSGQTKISKSGLSGLTAGLTGLLPAHEIDAESAQQIDSVLKPSPLTKPKCHVALNVAGLSDEDVAALFGARQRVPAQLDDDQHIADAMVELLTDLASANPDVSVYMLDQAAVEACNEGEDCMQQHLGGVAQAVGASVDSGVLILDDGVQLTDKLLASELSSFFAGVNSRIEAVNARAEAGSPVEDVQVMEMTMLGLQGLADQQLASSKQAVSQLLSWAVQQLDEAFGGEVTFQVATFDSLPEATPEAAVAWRARARSRMLAAASFPGADEEAQARLFSAKAAGYGAFILLLYFLLAGTYCLCNMPFKRDTLLYGSKKQE
eukprot:CAMPEP_0202865466 /NCGR_PEP_ID=MMETSP1391-20130828/6069_1 /ASSEMBLY_ACC=CAM_ASM_000867 /TAXON_ID=1034604 /ORGANISM="Chlamydomonas leiostraca, Strain SAG 11-49" /LENGTH=350 /DNA_ID=CAMNT_0049545313 /DNA_START=21 /DNA_END=1073 /DNA_ORIENTATION=+